MVVACAVSADAAADTVADTADADGADGAGSAAAAGIVGYAVETVADTVAVDRTVDCNCGASWYRTGSAD